MIRGRSLGESKQGVSDYGRPDDGVARCGMSKEASNRVRSAL